MMRYGDDTQIVVCDSINESKRKSLERQPAISLRKRLADCRSYACNCHCRAYSPVEPETEARDLGVVPVDRREQLIPGCRMENGVHFFKRTSISENTSSAGMQTAFPASISASLGFGVCANNAAAAITCPDWQ